MPQPQPDRLAAAAVSAFESAARKLNLDPLELALNMQDGGIADVIAALCDILPWAREATEMLGYDNAPDRSAEAVVARVTGIPYKEAGLRFFMLHRALYDPEVATPDAGNAG